MNNMAARTAFVNMRNFPVLPVKLSEGALTRANTFSPSGGRIDGMVSYAAAIAKGDLVELVTSSTDKGVIVVEALAKGAEGAQCTGIIVESPKGIDSATVSGQVPAIANKRMASAAFFGIGVVELTAGATITPGSVIVQDEGDGSYKGVAATEGQNGALVALTYAVVSEKVAVLVGASGGMAGGE